MPRKRHRSMHAFSLTAIILLLNCAVVVAAFAQSTTACLPTNCSAYTSIALPTEAEEASVPRASPECASYRSYRGLGRPINYTEARACAWRERLAQKADFGQNQKEPTAWVVGGSLILANLYLNGAGVKRDVPLAIRFACEAEVGMAELAQPEVAKFIASSPRHRPFEFCEYALTTFTMNFCVNYASDIEDDSRGRYYRSLKSSMTPEQQASFKDLLAAHDAYIGAHAAEVDQGGTIRHIRTLNSQSILENLFHTEIVQFERGKWPALSDSQVKTADRLLHSEYDKQIKQAQKIDAMDDGVVTAANLSSVEAVWETYRDAWVTFARLRYPVATTMIRAKITLDRYRLLKTIVTSGS